MAVGLFIVLWYIFLFEHKEMVWMYKGSTIKWFCYFLSMLLGAIIGLRSKRTASSCNWGGKNMIQIISVLLFCTLLFYGIQIAREQICMGRSSTGSDRIASDRYHLLFL